MNPNNSDDYISYRFQRSKETFEEALILAREERWNAVINRLYYACFYAVIALLIKKGDYGDMFDFDEESTKPLIGRVKSFIDEIEKHL